MLPPKKLHSRQKVIKTFFSSLPKLTSMREKLDVIHHSNPSPASQEQLLQKCDSNPSTWWERYTNSQVSVILQKEPFSLAVFLHTGAKPHFLSRNSLDFDISKMWILWKMRFQKGEFCKNWDFQYGNFWIKCGFLPQRVILPFYILK